MHVCVYSEWIETELFESTNKKDIVNGNIEREITYR